MAELVKLNVANAPDQAILFETSAPALPAGRGRATDVGITDWIKDRIFESSDGGGLTSTEAIAQAFEAIRTAALEGIEASEVEKSGHELKTIELSFGIKVSAEGNTFVAKAGMDANINVKFVWTKP
jgi:hypothetical protein